MEGIENIISKLYEGEQVPTRCIYEACREFLTPSRIRTLLRELSVFVNTVECEYLKDSQSCKCTVDFGKVGAVFDLLNWAFAIDETKRKIAQIAWRRQIAEFLTEAKKNSIK